jgi:PAS domain S-box-containing protein
MKKLFAKIYAAEGATTSMLYGVSSMWFFDTFPDMTRSAVYASIIPYVAAGMVCLALLWVLILRRKLVTSRLHASSQGARYRQFFDNCPDALMVVEIEGCIVSANPRACRLLKKDGQDLLAHTCWDFIEQVSLTEFRKKFKLCLEGKPMHCEAGIQIEDGAVIPVEMNGTFQRIDGRSLILLYIRDMRVQRETEDQVRSLYKQLEQAIADSEEMEAMVSGQEQRARDELIADINYRIRTPLDGIMGMGQLLSDSTLSIEQHNYLNVILNSASNLLKVIDSLGESPEDARKEPGPRAGYTDLHAICDSLHSKFEPSALRKGIELRCHCQGDVPAEVVADGKRLSQVLSGLLDNAFQQTIQGLVMLNIECRRQNSEKAEIYFQVIDTGLGIEEEFQTPIPEQSVDSDDTGTASGPNLAACRQIVMQMGGTIGQTNSVGKGSTYYFGLTFPLALPHDGTGDDGQTASSSEPSSCSIENAKVLVVDDNKVSQKVVTAMLHKAGAQVDIAGNGKEALSRIHEKEYDVVLMDCQMPVMDGHEATAGIRSMPEPCCSVPIIALTAHSLKHELRACRDSGMDDCLVKPIERRTLIDMVTRYVHEGRIKTALLKAS